MEQERQECSLVESRANLVRELSDMASAEEAFLESNWRRSPRKPSELADSVSGDGAFVYATYAKVEVAFREHFGKADAGERHGRDGGASRHGLRPSRPRGRGPQSRISRKACGCIEYLKENHIPFFAFRQAVKGKATGAHIHIGPMSTKLASGG